ncbi:GrpB family protein [Mycobacteroides chelonae]|uniref:GrpB family protein n=1 Tax=Mycobacteroides chelonae TaxID=1774 RepID=UPI0009BCE84A|nr:GrpB family protein [Mycobacteroides chelonae]
MGCGRYRLQSLLAPWRTDDVEHVGSTAVPGLAAKPILDLQAPVASLEVADAVADALAPHDWHYVPPHLDRRPYRRFFVKVMEGRRAAHLHLMANDARRRFQQLSFRDALRGDSDLVRAYAELKTLLAKQHRYDREAYTAGKQQFIQEVLNHPPVGK